MDLNVNIKWIVSVIIVVFLSLIVLNHFFKDLFKLNPYYRNKILLEGFDASGNVPITADASGPAPATTSSAPESSSSAPATSSAPESTSSAPATTSSAPATTSSAPATTSSAPATTSSTPESTSSAPASGPNIDETDKSTIMSDLFENVNQQMDTIRTLKLSDKFLPINIDKTASEPYLILTNLKLLINNGIYKNEMDLMEMYNKYIGNKAVKLLMSDINSINMESSDNSNIGSLETSFLTRSKSIVGGHQKIIDTILENKRKE